MPEQSSPTDWNARYRARDTPWDSGRVSAELRAVVQSGDVQPGRALELGCGSGTNSIFLAQRGFAVTAVDLSDVAIGLARDKAYDRGVPITFVQADVNALDSIDGPFDFIFDRGCYHCVRRVPRAGFLEALRRLTYPGSMFLLLAGNAGEVREHGPPTMHESEISTELGGLFDFLWIRPFRFEDADGSAGPLGWSAFMVRKPA